MCLSGRTLLLLPGGPTMRIPLRTWLSPSMVLLVWVFLLFSSTLSKSVPKHPREKKSLKQESVSSVASVPGGEFVLVLLSR